MMFKAILFLFSVFVLSGCQATSNATYSVSRFNPSFTSYPTHLSVPLSELGDTKVCGQAVVEGRWDKRQGFIKYVNEAKRRGLSCGVGETSGSPTAPTQIAFDRIKSPSIKTPTTKSSFGGYFVSDENYVTLARSQDNKTVCLLAVNNDGSWSSSADYKHYVVEAKRRGLSCGVGGSTQTASVQIPKAKPKVTSAALTAAEKEAERLRQELAALKAEQEQQQQTISSDTKLPTITIASASTKGKQGFIRGKARDNTGIAEVTVGGRSVPFDASGNFKFETFVPVGGKQVVIQVTDLNGLSNSKTVKLNRSASNTTTAITFESLNPLVRKVAKNADALALIIGVDSYENTPARAIYADKDAQVFADYATEKLGIPANRIKTLVNNGAGERELLLSVRSWLSRASKQGKTDVYVFFAGHGLASDDGQKMYLLPYDGAPELLDDTAILRDRLFSDISAANPRSVTVFLDTCYSGTTRGTDMLIASRPIAIRALEQSVPDNFTVMTAAAGDQTAKPLEEAKHGMFSYFLMKGMEGDADANNDNQITAGELHQYVQSNVIQQSSGSQTPELQGDANRVLVRFQ
jgi:hypothetical protein